MEHQDDKDTRCLLSTTTGSLVSPDGVSESLASAAKFSVSPISPPFSGQSCFLSLELENGHVRSTWDESQALNLFERVLHLTQGQMIVSYVIAESIADNRVWVPIWLDPKKGLSRDRENAVITDHSRDRDQRTIRSQRHILDRSPARPGPP
jgi:hypothetical protein